MQTESMRKAARHLLLVEDDLDSAKPLKPLPEQRGHKVYLASDRSSALAVAGMIHVDVLITDIGLPDGDGRKLLAEVKALYPVVGIALSGRSDPEDVELTAEMGFDTHLSKPLEFDKLIAALNKVGAVLR